MDHGTWACPMPALTHEVKAAAWRAKADFDMVESNALPRRPSPLPGGERSDRACAVRVRGNRRTIGSAAPSPGNGRASRAHSDLSPPGRGEKHSLNVIGKCSGTSVLVDHGVAQSAQLGRGDFHSIAGLEPARWVAAGP